MKNEKKLFYYSLIIVVVIYYSDFSCYFCILIIIIITILPASPFDGLVTMAMMKIPAIFFLRRWIRRRTADFKRAITQINFCIVDAYENCDKEKEREREVRWLLARCQKFTCPRCFRTRRLQIRCVHYPRLSSRFVESSIDEIYYAFNRVFKDFVLPW